jgi:putative transposase
MPYRKDQLATGKLYHVILRGLDDNLIFKDINDYYRGIFSIYEFNNARPVEIRKRRKARRKEKKKAIKNPLFAAIDKRDKLVDILSFCFMPNHIHLLVKQLKDGGITKFMAKVGTGYGRYFNSKYKRKGYVFQNRFHSVYIEDDNQLRVIFNYIHANPISLIEPGWKEKGISKPGEVSNFLKEYKWSSYMDYIGENNFPSVTERNFILEFIGSTKGCEEVIKDWVKYRKRLDKLKNILLEH